MMYSQRRSMLKYRIRLMRLTNVILTFFQHQESMVDPICIFNRQRRGGDLVQRLIKRVRWLYLKLKTKS